MQDYINRYIPNILSIMPKIVKVSDKYIDLKYELFYLLNVKDWTTEEENICEQLARKVDITKKYETKYTLEWKRFKGSEKLDDTHNSLAAFILYVSYKKLQENNTSVEELLIRMNALMKALDITNEPWIQKDSSLHIDIQNDFKALFESIAFEKSFSEKDIVDLKQAKIVNKTIPITILYSEGPISRAYLEVFKSMGLKPKKIIYMVSSVDIVTNKTIGNFLPLKLREKYAAYSQDSKINFWPRQIEKKYPDLQNMIFREVNEKYNIPFSMLRNTTKKLNLLDYSDNIETLLIDGLRDQKLLDKLIAVKEGAILYTGGGIVPQSLLSIPRTKFIHIHPGFLPDIRGADCTLWSFIMSGRASASCFYMSPGIDTGEIIMARWMPQISFSVNTNEYEHKTLYRAVYSYLDPWVRSVVLREFLNTYNEFDDIQAVLQDEKEGYTYYFMHNRVKKASLKSLFPLD